MTGNMEQLFIIGGVIFLGQFIYSAIGFGSGMVTVSLLVLLYGNVDVFVPMFLLLCLPAELLISWKDRKHIQLKKVFHFLMFIFPALVFGAWFLKYVEEGILVRILGCLIAVFALYYLFVEEKLNMTLKSRWWVALTGTLSGILGSTYGISGPPLIFYFKTLKLNKTEFRVALLSIFLSMSVSRTVVYYFFGFYNQGLLVDTAMTLPFALAGVGAGAFVHDRIPEKQFKMITSLVLLISGLLLIIK